MSQYRFNQAVDAGEDVPNTRPLTHAASLQIGGRVGGAPNTVGELFNTSVTCFTVCSLSDTYTMVIMKVGALNREKVFRKLDYIRTESD